MVGSGIASSLIHEVGHQGAALLDLVPSLRAALQGRQRDGDPDRDLWAMWERWISEIVADFWSVARVGITSTLGLIGVVSLPRPFVFRIDLNDPHPTPWLRVKLSAAIGHTLYPHPQWARIAALWEELYPRDGLDSERSALFERLEAHMPTFVALLAATARTKLGGRTLPEVLEISSARRPSSPGSSPPGRRRRPACIARGHAGLRGARARRASTATSRPKTKAR